MPPNRWRWSWLRHSYEQGMTWFMGLGGEYIDGTGLRASLGNDRHGSQYVCIILLSTTVENEPGIWCTISATCTHGAGTLTLVNRRIVRSLLCLSFIFGTHYFSLYITPTQRFTRRGGHRHFARALASDSIVSRRFRSYGSRTSGVVHFRFSFTSFRLPLHRLALKTARFELAPTT
jgi:hypothetical protein